MLNVISIASLAGQSEMGQKLNVAEAQKRNVANIIDTYIIRKMR